MEETRVGIDNVEVIGTVKDDDDNGGDVVAVDDDRIGVSVVVAMESEVAVYRGVVVVLAMKSEVAVVRGVAVVALGTNGLLVVPTGIIVVLVA